MEDKKNEKWKILIKRKNIVRFVKSQRLRWTAHVIRMDTIKIVKKSNWMGTMLIKTSRKTKSKVTWPSRRGLKEDKSKKLEKEV
jgi:hypothetical protein